MGDMRACGLMMLRLLKFDVRSKGGAQTGAHSQMFVEKGIQFFSAHHVLSSTTTFEESGDPVQKEERTFVRMTCLPPPLSAPDYKLRLMPHPLLQSRTAVDQESKESDIRIVSHILLRADAAHPHTRTSRTIRSRPSD